MRGQKAESLAKTRFAYATPRGSLPMFSSFRRASRTTGVGRSDGRGSASWRCWVTTQWPTASDAYDVMLPPGIRAPLLQVVGRRLGRVRLRRVARGASSDLRRRLRGRRGVVARGTRSGKSGVPGWKGRRRSVSRLETHASCDFVVAMFVLSLGDSFVRPQVSHALILDIATCPLRVRMHLAPIQSVLIVLGNGED